MSKKQISNLDTDPIPYEISFNDAVMLIHAFLRQRALRDVGMREAIGGTLAKESLRSVIKPNPGGHEGAMAWFCRNNYDNLPEYPPMYLAFEHAEYNFGE